MALPAGACNVPAWLRGPPQRPPISSHPVVEVPVPAVPALAPKTQRFHAKREAVLDAAARQFNAQGIRGAGLGDIAASVGLVKSGITYYFRKKEDLAAACLLRAIAEAQALVLAAAGQTTVPQRVEHFLVALAGQLAAIERGERSALIGFSDTRSLPEAQATEVFAAYVDLFRSVRGLLSGPGLPALGREARNTRAFLLLTTAHALPAWVRRCEPDQYLRLARRVTDLLLHGVLVSPQAWPGAAESRRHPLPDPPPGADDTAEAFLRAATALINEHGYRGASVDKIAALLDGSKGKFYHHNDTKHDLVSACFDRSFAVQRHFLQAAESMAGPLPRRLAAYAQAMVRFQLSDRGPLLRASAYSALPDEQHRQAVVRTVLQLADRLNGLLVDGLAEGSVRPLDTALAAEVLGSTLNAALELRRWVPGLTADTALRLYTRPGLLGLLCEE